MNRLNTIAFKEDFKIACFFSNGESRLLELKKVLDSNDKYAKKIFHNHIFEKAEIGEFGEIFWPGLAEMRDERGKLIPCAYDISPEFVYHNSTPCEESKS